MVVLVVVRSGRRRKRPMIDEPTASVQRFAKVNLQEQQRQRSICVLKGTILVELLLGNGKVRVTAIALQEFILFGCRLWVFFKRGKARQISILLRGKPCFPKQSCVPCFRMLSSSAFEITIDSIICYRSQFCSYFISHLNDIRRTPYFWCIHTPQ